MFEVGKEYKTRDGSRARIYATDGAQGLMHGAVFTLDGWSPRVWHTDGENMFSCDSLVRPKRKYLKSMATLLAEFPNHHFDTAGHLYLHYKDVCGRASTYCLHTGYFYKLGTADVESREWPAILIEEREE
jgi:hypothetical protein